MSYPVKTERSQGWLELTIQQEEREDRVCNAGVEQGEPPLSTTMSRRCAKCDLLAFRPTRGEVSLTHTNLQPQC